MKNNGFLYIYYNVQSVIDAQNHLVIDISTTSEKKMHSCPTEDGLSVADSPVHYSIPTHKIGCCRTIIFSSNKALRPSVIISSFIIYKLLLYNDYRITVLKYI